MNFSNDNINSEIEYSEIFIKKKRVEYLLIRYIECLFLKNYYGDIHELFDLIIKNNKLSLIFYYAIILDEDYPESASVVKEILESVDELSCRELCITQKSEIFELSLPKNIKTSCIHLNIAEESYQIFKEISFEGFNKISFVSHSPKHIDIIVKRLNQVPPVFKMLDNLGRKQLNKKIILSIDCKFSDFDKLSALISEGFILKIIVNFPDYQQQNTIENLGELESFMKNFYRTVILLS
jgi:hypothetical protein